VLLGKSDQVDGEPGGDRMKICPCHCHVIAAKPRDAIACAAADHCRLAVKLFTQDYAPLPASAAGQGDKEYRKRVIGEILGMHP
jgi:hypothetical protein